MNPFISFCLYVAARVFVQYLKSRQKDSQIRHELQFLLSAMHAIKRKNPLTESFIVQLDVDLEGAGLENSHELRVSAPLSDVVNKPSGCPTALLAMQTTVPNCGVTYGDNGLAMYNEPHKQDAPMTSSASTADAFGYPVVATMEDTKAFSAFSIPTRNRSSESSRAQISPDMDMSPANSGDLRTPGSQNNGSSTQTSHTGYSPQNQAQNNPQHTANGLTSLQNQATTSARAHGIFENGDVDFSTDFEIHSFPASSSHNQQSGFVLPQGWGSGGSTGMTPGVTGMTPGPTGMTPGSTEMTPGADMMGMSEADWTQVLEGFQTWDSGSGAGHDQGYLHGTGPTGSSARR